MDYIVSTKQVLKMRLQNVVRSIRDTPELLERMLPDLRKFLTSKAGKSGQGVANSIPDHEVCFADVLNSNGFLFLSKDKPPLKGYPCYHHQLGGTQTKTDFHVYETINEKIVTTLIDLKHTNGKTFYLNDGWFETDTIYIVNWTEKKQQKVLIALGQDIPSDEEIEEFNRLLELKQLLNSNKRTTGSLVKYIRFANQYKCRAFTDEFVTSRFERVNAFLEKNDSPTQSIEQEPRFQSALQPMEVCQQTDNSQEIPESEQVLSS